jgi:toxin ParE1/3/4
MKLVFADEAKADLARIGDWIAKDNPVRAITFLDELERRCLQLTSMPRAFGLVPGHEDSGVRRRPYRDYLIFYRVGVDVVEVLHVPHGARDYESILFPDE